MPGGPGHFKTKVGRGLVWASSGQLDTGFASLASFVCGLVAVRSLDVEALAAYALLFSSFFVASQFPAELIFNPSQVLAIDLPIGVRLGMMRHSARIGLGVSVASAVVVPLGVLPVLTRIPAQTLLPLVVTATALTIVSPLQDHLRALLHLANRSWHAAATSAIHFLGTAATVLIVYPEAPLLAPFGALTVGNLLSCAMAAWWILRQRPDRVPSPTLREFQSLGGWLLATGLSRTVLGYGTRSIISAVAGVTALGLLEGARVVAQPVFVLASGLIAQVGPKATEAGATGDLEAARKWRTRFVVMLSAVAVPYAVLTAFPWAMNPLARLIPLAYDIPGLTAAMLIAVWLTSLLRPFKAEMMGARLQRSLTYLTVILGILETAVALAGSQIGAFAVPAGMALSAVIMFVLIKTRLTSRYMS